MFDPIKEQQKMFETWNENMKKAMNPNFADMQKAMFPNMDAMKAMYENMQANTQQAYGEMQEKTKAMYAEMQEKTKAMYANVPGYENFTKMYDEMQDKAKAMYGEVPGYTEFTKMYEDMQTKAKEMYGKVPTSFDDYKAMYEDMEAKAKEMYAKVPGYEEFTKVYEDMQAKAKEMYGKVPTSLDDYKAMYEDMQAKAKEMYGKVPTSFEDYKAMYEDMQAKAKEMYGKVPTSFEDYKAMYEEMQAKAKEMYGNFEIPGFDMNGFNFPGFEMPGYEDYMKKFGEMFPQMDNYAKLFEVKVPGLEMYNQLYDFYKGLTNPADFTQNLQDNYNKMFSALIQNVIPNENFAELFKHPQDLIQSCVKFYQNMMSPWMKIDEDLVKRVMDGDVNAAIQFFTEISEKYDATFGKVVKMMNMGINLEVADEQQRAMDAYFKLMFSAGKLAAILSKSNNDSSKTLTETYQKMIKAGQEVTTFKEFYDLWYNTNEKAMEDLFATETFSKAFADFTDKYFKYMAASNAVLERNLAKLPIPTNKDMNSLYLTVYNLRKDVRDLKREIESLKTVKTPAASKAEKAEKAEKADK